MGSITSLAQPSRTRSSRSSPSRSRPALVSAPASRLSTWAVTRTAMSALVSSAPRKSPPPSVAPSSSPSCPSSQSVAATGVTSWVSPIPFPARFMAGLEDVYTSACGGTATLGNFAKATFQAICRTNDFLTPELWKEEALLPPPLEAHSEYLQKNHKIGGVQRGEVKNY